MDAIKQDASLATTEDLLHHPANGCRYELIRGELLSMSPTGGRHGLIAQRLGLRLGTWAEAQDAGLVFAAETGFK